MDGDTREEEEPEEYGTIAEGPTEEEVTERRAEVGDEEETETNHRISFPHIRKSRASSRQNTSLHEDQRRQKYSRFSRIHRIPVFNDLQEH